MLGYSFGRIEFSYFMWSSYVRLLLVEYSLWNKFVVFCIYLLIDGFYLYIEVCICRG